MDVVITKAEVPGAPDRTLLIDTEGARRVPVHVVHDLPHLVVESLLGLDDGLWGELASGRHAEAAAAASARDPRRRKLGRIVSGAASGEPLSAWLSEGHRSAKTLTNAVTNHWHDGPDTPAGVRERVDRAADAIARLRLDSVDDTTLQLAIDGVRDVLDRWSRIPPGGTLRLTWPLTYVA